MTDITTAQIPNPKPQTEFMTDMTAAKTPNPNLFL